MTSSSPAPAATPAGVEIGGTTVRVVRLPGNPIVRPDMDARMGTNVQGPSLIRVPDWLPDRLGRYYLYLADHKGSYIRLAYADRLEGPWTTWEPGTLQLAESGFLTKAAPVPDKLPDGSSLEDYARQTTEGVPTALLSATLPHIASPDAHVRADLDEIVLYYHGLDGFRSQHTRVARSRDGIHFTALPDLIGRSYLHAFQYRDAWYAMAMPGIFYRSADGLAGFEEGPVLFPPTQRHAALLVRGDTLWVFWTRVGDAPERILVSTVELAGDWSQWQASEPVDLLRPEEDWEGADLPVEPSVRDAINIRVNQLRDPAIYEEEGRVFLLYAVAGESGIAIAELLFGSSP